MQFYFVNKRNFLIILPLSSFLPPMFRKRKSRFILLLILHIIGIVGLLSFFFSNLVWVGIVSQSELYYNLNGMIRDTASSLVMTLALLYLTVRVVQHRGSDFSDPMIRNLSYPRKLGRIHGAQLLLSNRELCRRAFINLVTLSRRCCHLC